MTLGCTSPEDVIRAIKDHEVEIVDLRFTDLPGMWQHISYPAGAIDVEASTRGSASTAPRSAAFRRSTTATCC